MREAMNQRLSKPVLETHTDELPTALTFFLTRAQRTHVLRSLRAFDTDRAKALLIALGTESKEVCS